MAISVNKVEQWTKKKKTAKLQKALSEASVEIRIAAAKGLGTIMEENAMYSLIPLLKDPDKSVREAALEALGALANERSLEFIKQMLNVEKDDSVREKAKWAIGVIKENMPKDHNS